MASFVLMGSGEYTSWARDADTWALEQSTVSSDRVLLSPLAAAPEGDEVFARWASMGVAHFEALGVRPEVLEMRTRADAEDPSLARAIDGARYVFFSGGNPGFLASSLAGTAVWDAIVRAVASGMPLGGCSAGMVALGVTAPDTAQRGWVPGLALFSNGFLNAHWDALDSYEPGLTQRILDAWPQGSVLFAVDEDTSAIGDGTRWRVTGKSGLTIPSMDGLERITNGNEVTVDLGLQL